MVAIPPGMTPFLDREPTPGSIMLLRGHLGAENRTRYPAARSVPPFVTHLAAATERTNSRSALFVPNGVPCKPLEAVG